MAMSKVVHLDPPQIVQSAQVWECTSCGSRDNKSCSCNSTAIMVKLLEDKAKQRERDRQKKIRKRASVPGDADLENTKEKIKPTTSVTFYRDPLTELDEDDDVSNPWVFINRCGDAASDATYEGPVNRDVLRAARWTRDQWIALVTKLEVRNQEE
jgi:hypothetical protein